MPTFTSVKTNPLLYLIKHYATYGEAVEFLLECGVKDPDYYMAHIAGIQFPVRRGEIVW